MKTIIIFLTFFFPTVLFGQMINHYNHIDSRWNVAKTYPAANQQNPNFAATTTTVFGFNGDSLINNKKWFKLFSTDDSLFQNNLVYRGLIRTKNNLVLYRDTLNQLDTLYNFNLNIGDSVLFDFYGMYPEWLAVIDIDSMQLNGTYYKRLKFAEPSITAFDKLNEEWIEGIGSIHGPLFPHFPVKFSEETPDSMLLICSFSDNQEIWQHPSYSSCYIKNVLSIGSLEIPDFKIYPNPFTDKITLENSGTEKLELTILNSLGQVVRQIKIRSNNEILDFSELKDGIYLLRISKQGETKTMKLIKKQ